jgi:tyrosine-protein kinase Etk/Wzc
MQADSNRSSERSLLDGFLHYLGILLRWKWVVIGIPAVAIIVTAAFCAVSILMPPDKSPLPNVYTAEATILILPQGNQSDISSTILSALGISSQSGQASEFDNGLLVMELLRSRSLLDRLNSEFNMTAHYKIRKNPNVNARQAILAHSNFIYSRENGFFRITYTDIDPVLCRNVVNRMVSLLDEWVSQNRGLAKQKQRDILEDKIGEVKNDILTLQSRLKNLQKKYGVLTAQDLGATQAALLANLRSQLILKEIEIKNYSSFSKINDSRLEQLNEERKNLLELINQNQAGLEVNPTESGTGKTIPDVAQEFSQLNAELEIQQRIYNTLSSQYEASKLTPESEPIFQIFEMAEIPDVKSGPQRTKFLLFAGAGGFAFGIVLVLALNVIIGFFNDPAKMRLLKGKL